MISNIVTCWLIFGSGLFLYAFFNSYLFSYRQLVQLQNELSILHEDILQMKEMPESQFKTENKVFGKSISKPTTSVMTQIFVMKETLQTIRNELDELRATSYQKANFALESNGAEIISIFDTNMESLCSIFEYLIFYVLGMCRNSYYPPRYLIQGKIEPGQCWKFIGKQGKVLIKLSNAVFIDSVAIQHIYEHEAINGVTDAPKDFKVYVSNDVKSTKTLLIGTFQYDIHAKKSIQVFQITKRTQISFQYVIFDFSSNSGHESHTCVYRVRVHGEVDRSKLEQT